MNREEPANRSMGFFAIFKEAYKLTALNKNIFSKITLTILFPLAILYLSDIHISHFIHSNTYSENETSRWITYGITQPVYLFVVLLFTLWSSSTVMYTIACFYTSKDITYKKVTRVLRKLWGRLIATFLWCFFIVAVYTFIFLYLCMFFGYMISGKGFGDEERSKLLIFALCLSIPFFPGLINLMAVWNVATVVTVLEKDCGTKAFRKSQNLISGKRWVCWAVFGLLEIAFTGIIFTFWYLVVYGNKMNLVGKVFVGIGCYLLMTVWIHFSLVVQTVVYFVCKSYHNEDISTVAAYLEVPVIRLGRENEVQLEPVPA